MGSQKPMSVPHQEIIAKQQSLLKQDYGSILSYDGATIQDCNNI